MVEAIIFSVQLKIMQAYCGMAIIAVLLHSGLAAAPKWFSKAMCKTYCNNPDTR